MQDFMNDPERIAQLATGIGLILGLVLFGFWTARKIMGEDTWAGEVVFAFFGLLFVGAAATNCALFLFIVILKLIVRGVMG